MRDSYKDKDGLERNLLRHRDEWLDFVDYWNEDIPGEPGKKHRESHAPFLNALVEMSRHVPWLAGHLWLYTLIILGLTTLGGIFVW